MKYGIISVAVLTVCFTTALSSAQTKVVVVPMGGKKATGNAVAADVLEGRTFSNKDEVGVAGIMVNNGAMMITPSNQIQSIPEGYHNGSGSVATDANLVSGNIRSGTSIFGVPGSSIPASGSATDADVLSGVTYSNATGASIGTMPDNGPGGTITPTTTDQGIAAGYWSSANTVQGDANLVGGNIRSGTSIFGVPGSSIPASGSATDADVRSGATYSNASGPSTGTMPDNGAGGTITPTTSDQNIAAGYWSSVNTVQGDANLVGGNIRSGTSIFGIEGTYPLAQPAATGQTTSSQSGDDGDKLMGATVSGDRFTDNGDGTVTDNLTGLIWLKNANCFGTQNWTTAITSANTLADSSCGLSDGSSAGDWRLPNIKELHTLIDFGQYFPAFPADHPFSNVQTNDYWSSTTTKYNSDWAWFVGLASGNVNANEKTSAYSNYVWPVRGGQ